MTVRLPDLLDLVRAPAALTVLGDTAVGAVNARGAAGGAAVPLALASACLYAAGMALNDYADADLDALERPERPIPSGRVSRKTALRTGGVLTVAGISLAFSAGKASGWVSVALAASVWTYDLVAKPTRLGPVVMAACRGLDVLMGAAGPGWQRALTPALAIAAHTGALTVVAAGEVHGTTRAAAATAAAVSVGAAAAGVVGAGAHTSAALVGGAGYLAATLPSQIDAAREPDAAHARSAARHSIHAMIPLQIALVARTGAVFTTAALLGVQLAGRLLAAARTRGDVT
ncbi:SCO3242 family prenyltransferase [Microbacterium sp. P04]|uniref:SCO3242 family prenyltransferase n=1 Tax=Microbacterium sp. P04 TaxID=3366947 RepID=UPI003745E4CB